jgi:hypothetical protein
VDLALAARAQRDELGPVPHQLPQLPRGRRRDPRLGKPAHPQQVGQVRGVPHVVLDPAMLEHLHPERVRQVNDSTRGLEGVRGPVPAVRRLEHDLGRLTRPGDHGGERVQVVVDPHRF